ncbi:MAG: hypothetical protein ACLQFR_02495 [Streptosporangiaceae bacterium]
MRDPGLVQRAERAALALERAWGQWRNQHGLGAQPPTPVSSYVGYSLEEPWGQPRVVFGVGAEEAEMLAALLAGQDYVGPVHAEMTDWRRSRPAAPPLPVRGRLVVPAQAPSPVESAQPSAEPAQLGPVAQVPGNRDAAEHDEADQEAVPAEAVPAEAVPREIVPLEDLVPLPPEETSDAPFEAPSQGPGYCGPRYQGFPPQYQPEGAVLGGADGAIGADESAAPAGEQPNGLMPQVVARLTRSLRSQRGSHDPGWTQEHEHHQDAADEAV